LGHGAEDWLTSAAALKTKPGRATRYVHPMHLSSSWFLTLGACSSSLAGALPHLPSWMLNGYETERFDTEKIRLNPKFAANKFGKQ
jgi:hypothetical protein